MPYVFRVYFEPQTKKIHISPTVIITTKYRRGVKEKELKRKVIISF